MALLTRWTFVVVGLTLLALATPLSAQAQLLDPLSPEELEAILEHISGADPADPEALEELVLGGLDSLSPAEVEAIWEKIRAAQAAAESSNDAEAEATD